MKQFSEKGLIGLPGHLAHSGPMIFHAAALVLALILTGCPQEDKAGELEALSGSVSIDGKAKVGQTLMANTTAPAGTGTISYQWNRGDTAAAEGTAIPGATGAAYNLTTADKGKYITVTVRLSGFDGTKTSNALGPVAVVTSDTDPTVTSVTVHPAAVSVPQGRTQQFTVTVSGQDNPAQTVIWSLEGTYASGTAISKAGLLKVAATETATTVRVKAASMMDTTQSGTAEVTVTATVNPEDGNNTFTIEYERETIILKDPDGAPVNAITLSKTGGPSTITLSADGVFTGVTWYVDDDGITGSSLILKAANYGVKTHSVTFTGWRDGSYLSSAPISFTVTN